LLQLINYKIGYYMNSQIKPMSFKITEDNNFGHKIINTKIENLIVKY